VTSPREPEMKILGPVREGETRLHRIAAGSIVAALSRNPPERKGKVFCYAFLSFVALLVSAGMFVETEPVPRLTPPATWPERRLAYGTS